MEFLLSLKGQRGHKNPLIQLKSPAVTKTLKKERETLHCNEYLVGAGHFAPTMCDVNALSQAVRWSL